MFAAFQNLANPVRFKFQASAEFRRLRQQKSAVKNYEGHSADYLKRHFLNIVNFHTKRDRKSKERPNCNQNQGTVQAFSTLLLLYLENMADLVQIDLLKRHKSGVHICRREAAAASLRAVAGLAVPVRGSVTPARRRYTYYDRLSKPQCRLPRPFSVSLV
ncbi:hypothetical protein ACJJTC_015457 [Scirpophaga incertulas]